MAVWLAEGKRVREMAETTGHTTDAIYWRPAAYLQEAVSLPTGGPRAAGAVDRRIRLTPRGGRRRLALRHDNP